MFQLYEVIVPRIASGPSVMRYYKEGSHTQVEVSEIFGIHTMIRAITSTQVLAAMYGEWATNIDIFDHFLEYHLCSVLKPEHVVILDNIAFHHNV